VDERLGRVERELAYPYQQNPIGSGSISTQPPEVGHPVATKSGEDEELVLGDYEPPYNENPFDYAQSVDFVRDEDC
jgi:hypothetical protein